MSKDKGRLASMRVCKRCRKETEEVFCPSCKVLTAPVQSPETGPVSVAGESFDCTIWQGPNRSRGIEVPVAQRDRFFSKRNEEVVLHIDGKRTVAKLGASFWKKPAVIKRALTDNGRDELIKFFEKHHLLPPEQSLKEKGIVDTVIFEVVTPREEFRISVVERQGQEDSDSA